MAALRRGEVGVSLRDKNQGGGGVSTAALV
jgi:hypothetical protein